MDWVWILLGVGTIAIGVHHVVFAAQFEDELDDSRIKLLAGGSGLRLTQRGQGYFLIVSGLVWIAIAAGDPSGEPINPAYPGIFGAALVLMGAWEAFGQDLVGAWRREGPAGGDMAEGDARFYTPPGPPTYAFQRSPVAKRKSSGVINLILGASFLVLSITI